MAEGWDLDGRVCVVTGANTGIGRATARELARRGARVVLAARSEERTRPVVDEIRSLEGGRGEYLHLDLASLASVREAAQALLDRELPLHVLVNNAGVGGGRGKTVDGFERAFGINHLGHYVFTRWLLPRMEASAPARIVNVASDAHYRATGIDWKAVRRRTRSVGGFPEYQRSKLANVLFTRELARRLEGTGITTYAVHPGVVATDIWRNVPRPVRALVTRRLRTPEEGSRTPVFCAAAPELGTETGGYYADERPRTPSAVAQDDALAAELWRRSEEWTEEFLPR